MTKPLLLLPLLLKEQLLLSLFSFTLTLLSFFLFPLQATQFSITYLPFSGPEEHIPGRRTVTQLIENANISSHTFSFSKVNNHLPYFGKYIREMHEGIHQQLANDFPSPFALQGKKKQFRTDPLEVWCDMIFGLEKTLHLLSY